LDAIKETFAYRGDAISSKIHEVIAEINRDTLKRGWKAATGLLVTQPDFDSCFDTILNWFQSNDI
jgi:hypothetical protein